MAELGGKRRDREDDDDDEDNAVGSKEVIRNRSSVTRERVGTSRSRRESRSSGTLWGRRERERERDDVDDNDGDDEGAKTVLASEHPP